MSLFRQKMPAAEEPDVPSLDISVKAEAIPFDAGVRRCLELISTVIHRPVLVGVYGMPNHGKSYLISALKDLLIRDGWTVCAGSGAASQETFLTIQRNQQEYPQMLQRTVNFFHYGAQMYFRDDDPAVLCQSILGRPLNLAIGIYNPNMSESHPDGCFDLIISNPASNTK